jgi:phospholipid/cholesterol/gamma-HCH transport system ATP-binding protein
VLLGPSGCGKSVTLKLILGLLLADRGRVLVRDGQTDRFDDVGLLDRTSLLALRRRIGIVFQGGALFDSLTVGENVAFPLDAHTVMDEDEKRRRGAHLLGLVGLAGIESRWPAELSGGMRKRVSLARALALEPQIVLYDEPTTGLDPIRTREIDDLIVRMRHELGLTGLVVTHDIPSTLRIADRIAMLREGRVHFTGTVAEFLASSDPTVVAFRDGAIGGLAS